MRDLKEHPGFQSYQAVSTSGRNMKAFVIVLLLVFVAAIAYTLLEVGDTMEKAVPIEHFSNDASHQKI